MLHQDFTDCVLGSLSQQRWTGLSGRESMNGFLGKPTLVSVASALTAGSVFKARCV